MHTNIIKHQNEHNHDYGDYNSTKQKLDSNAEMSEAKDWQRDEWQKHYKESWLPKDKAGNIVSGTKYDDPHELHLYQLKTQAQEKEMTTMFDFINTFFRESDKYIEQHQSRVDVMDKIDKNTKSLQEMSQQLTKKERIVFSKNEKEIINGIIPAVVEIENQKLKNLPNVDADVNSSSNILNEMQNMKLKPLSIS